MRIHFSADDLAEGTLETWRAVYQPLAEADAMRLGIERRRPAASASWSLVFASEGHCLNDLL